MRLRQCGAYLKLHTGTHNTSQAVSRNNQSIYMISSACPLERGTIFLISVAEWKVLRTHLSHLYKMVIKLLMVRVSSSPVQSHIKTKSRTEAHVQSVHF